VRPSWRSHKVKLRNQDLVARSRLPTLERVEGRVGSPGIRLGRDQAFRLHEPASQTNTSWLESILGPFGVGTSHGHSNSLGHTTPRAREYATTILPIVYSAPHFGGYIQMAQIPGTPEMESRSCPEIVPGGVSGLWELITPDCEIGSRRGLNRTCSPRRDLSNDVSHSQFGLREEVDSRLLVVGSQTATLTPGLSFAHNLGDRCPNAQCEGIFHIYASRPFQWHQEHPNARCFGSCCWALNIRESRRTPSPQLFQVLGFTLTLGQVRVATWNMLSNKFN
jgi:hypothetical protein